MAAVTEDVPQDPAYITYLLTPKLCDSFFVVGNREQMEPERIGVVRKMLLAHSEVLRSDMFAQELENKKDVPVNDTHPDTFKNLLRYVYGYDNTGQLDFDEADNLLYVAEKWQVLTLKSRLSTRLIQLLTSDNICSLLNNPAVYKVLELDSTITRILQYETDLVLGSPSFLDLSVDGLVKIFEQEALGVAEIDVWRAAVRWAKHRVGSDSGTALRQELERPAKHIRVCTIDDSSFNKEVVTSGVLTNDEIALICYYKGGEVKQQELTTFSNEVLCRTHTSQICVLSFDYLTNKYTWDHCEFYLLTKCHAIEQLPLKCRAKSSPYSLAPAGLTYEVKCTIEITRITNYSDNTSTEDPETSVVTQQVEYGKEFTVPLTKGGKNMVLRPNNLYKVMMRFSDCVLMYYNKYNVMMTFSEDVVINYTEEDMTCDNEHITVKICQVSGDYFLPINTLSYRPLPQV